MITSFAFSILFKSQLKALGLELFPASGIPVGPSYLPSVELKICSRKAALLTFATSKSHSGVFKRMPVSRLRPRLMLSESLVIGDDSKDFDSSQMQPS